MSAAIGNSASWRRRLPALAADVVAVTKPRIVSLLVFTGATSAIAAGGGVPRPLALVAVVVGGGFGAAGANALNCMLDRDIDARMRRTQSRPVPAGRLPAPAALALGLGLLATSMAVLTAWANWQAALLTLGGGLWYVFVYTVWLKRRTVENIVVGGAAGCFPVLVGWAAVTGSTSATALALAGIILLWTPPHFWALATLLEGDYRRVGIPMLPVVVGARPAARRMLAYALATVALSLAPVVWHGLGWPYLVAALGLGAWFAWACKRHFDAPSHETAARVFRASIVYLAGLFTAAAIGGVLR